MVRSVGGQSGVNYQPENIEPPPEFKNLKLRQKMITAVLSVLAGIPGLVVGGFVTYNYLLKKYTHENFEKKQQKTMNTLKNAVNPVFSQLSDSSLHSIGEIISNQIPAERDQIIAPKAQENKIPPKELQMAFVAYLNHPQNKELLDRIYLYSAKGEEEIKQMLLGQYEGEISSEIKDLMNQLQDYILNSIASQSIGRPSTNIPSDVQDFLDRWSLRPMESGYESGLQEPAFFGAAAIALNKPLETLKKEFDAYLDDPENRSVLDASREKFPEVDNDTDLKDLLKGAMDAQILSPRKKVLLDEVRAQILSSISGKRIVLVEPDNKKMLLRNSSRGKTVDEVQILGGTRKVPIVRENGEYESLLAALAKRYVKESDKKIVDFYFKEFANDPSNDIALQRAYFEIQDESLQEGGFVGEVINPEMFELILKGESRPGKTGVSDQTSEEVRNLAKKVLGEAYAFWKFKVEMSAYVNNSENEPSLREIFENVYKGSVLIDFNVFKQRLLGNVVEPWNDDDQKLLDAALIMLVEKMREVKIPVTKIITEGGVVNKTVKEERVLQETGAESIAYEVNRSPQTTDVYIEPRLLVKK